MSIGLEIVFVDDWVEEVGANIMNSHFVVGSMVA